MGFYSSFSEQDLIESYKNQIDYQEKISDELLEEITQRGSLKDFQDKIENQRKILDERNRIIREIHQHYMNKRSKEECFSLLDSNILSQKEIKILVHTKYYQIKYNIDNLKVDLNIIVRSFAGIFIASSISTLIMSSLLIAVNELIVFHLFLLYLIANRILNNYIETISFENTTLISDLLNELALEVKNSILD